MEFIHSVLTSFRFSLVKYIFLTAHFSLFIDILTRNGPVELSNENHVQLTACECLLF